jgi:hypothetical protein
MFKRLQTVHWGLMAAALALTAVIGVASLSASPKAAAATNDRATLFFIKTKNTGSGRVEIHTATAASNYKKSDLHTATYFTLTDAKNGYFQMVGRDLYYIKVCNTGSGHVEVHSATASSNYKSGAHLVYYDTSFSGSSCQAQVEQGSQPSKPIINGFSATGRPYLFSASGTYDNEHASMLYQGFNINNSMINAYTSTPFLLSDVYGTDINGSGTGELSAQGDAATFIKLRNTASNKIEYSRTTSLNKGDGPVTASLVLTTPTAFNLYDADNGTFGSTDVNGDGQADVTFVKTKNTSSNRVEVFDASATNYKKLALAASTYFSLTDGANGIWQLGSTL